MTNPANKYVESVLNGDTLACKWVKLACERHLNDLEHGHERGLYFDEEAAARSIRFFEGKLLLWKGRGYKNKPFILGPHFQFILSSIMGWKFKDTELRRFKTAYIEMGRKGAKSTFAGGLGAYFLIADDEPGAEIYSAAVKYDQAKIVWENIQKLTMRSKFKDKITYLTHNISIEETWSKCQPLSSDSKSLDGLDTHYASLDELHAHPTPAVHDLVVDSVGSRSQPLILIITTAGFDQAGICYQRREYLTKILKGVTQDDSFFGVIYTLDRKQDWPSMVTKLESEAGKPGVVEDDWTNEDLWVKPMPGLCGITENGVKYGLKDDRSEEAGYMTKIEDVRDKCRYAKEQVAGQNNFLTKRMNIWVGQAERWIDLALWDKNHTSDVYVMKDNKVDWQDTRKKYKGRWCTSGIDLSSVDDLTCVVYMFPDEKNRQLVDVIMRAWCPEHKIYDPKNKYKEQYQMWAKMNWIHTTPGNAIDYDFILKEIEEDTKYFDVGLFGVDRAFDGVGFSMKLADRVGHTEKRPKVITCTNHPTRIGPICAEFERRLLELQINHGGNPILRFMIDSTAVKIDADGNKKCDKSKSQGKIDGVISMLYALDRLMRSKPQPKIKLPVAI